MKKNLAGSGKMLVDTFRVCSMTFMLTEDLRQSLTGDALVTFCPQIICLKISGKEASVTSAVITCEVVR